MRATLPAVLLFLTIGSLAAAETRTVSMYDLTDLVELPRDFPPTILGARKLREESAAIATAVSPREEASVEALLHRLFEPGMVALIREQSETTVGTLVLNAAPDLHQHVSQVLAAARERVGLQIHLDIHLVLMDPKVRQARFALPGLEWRSLPDQPGLAFADLSATDTAAVMQTVIVPRLDEPGADAVVHQSLTCFAGQLACASNITQRAYAPLSFATSKDTQSFGILTLGDTLAIRATPTTDRRFIMLDIDHARCALLELKTIDLGAAGKGEEPILWNGGERLQRSILLGHSLLIATGTYLGGTSPRSGFLLITPGMMNATGKPIAPASAPEAQQ